MNSETTDETPPKGGADTWVGDRLKCAAFALIFSLPFLFFGYAGMARLFVFILILPFILTLFLFGLSFVPGLFVFTIAPLHALTKAMAFLLTPAALKRTNP